MVTVKAADELPDWTITEVGTDAAVESLLDNATTIPPVGAASDRVTVP